MQSNLSTSFDADAVFAWTAYQAFIRQLVEARQVTQEVGERLCSAVGRDKWYLGYRRERAGGLSQATHLAL